MSVEKDANKRGLSRILIVGMVFSSLASIFALGYMVTVAIRAVRQGDGLATFRSQWLVEDNWIGFLTFVAATVLALAIGLIWRLRERREWKELEDRYGSNKGDA
ncbi:hypothetical protein BurJ1DRAFT_1941 [Burkholderiales bacterium JOSHI_001]|nr:hypothetical protein BurJ1DRAFT_1941 [Burkholderiales bacterium JOSHI_001]